MFCWSPCSKTATIGSNDLSFYMRVDEKNKGITEAQRYTYVHCLLFCLKGNGLKLKKWKL